MIAGIGVDMVKVSRIEKAISSWGDRFINRIFTANEYNFIAARHNHISAFALHFAAKEAFSKAVGTGMRGGFKWSDVEVFHYASGKPGLKLYGRANELCQDLGVERFHLSLSDDSGLAIAIVILES